jgi:hypothetical protein
MSIREGFGDVRKSFVESQFAQQRLETWLGVQRAKRRIDRQVHLIFVGSGASVEPIECACVVSEPDVDPSNGGRDVGGWPIVLMSPSSDERVDDPLRFRSTVGSPIDISEQPPPVSVAPERDALRRSFDRRVVALALRVRVRSD